MAGLRVLVVEDQLRWRRRLTEILQSLDRGATQVDAAAGFTEALEKLTSQSYDLAVVDLSLLRRSRDPRNRDELGFDLLRELRANPEQRRCGVIVFTGAQTTRRIHTALRQFGAYEVVLKNEFAAEDDGEERLLELARAAILEGRVRGAAERRASRSYLTMTFDRAGWIESELRTPSGAARNRMTPSLAFDDDNLVRRADNINRFLIQDATYDGWRSEMRDIGAALYRTIAGVSDLYDKWASARLLPREPGRLWLRFRGPAAGLGIPFDLLWDGEEYFCLRHVLSREVERPGFTREGAPFSVFIDDLRDRHRPLRVLLVAANTDGKIPAVEVESEQLEREIGTELRRVGLRCEVTRLTSAEATYSRVRDELRHGAYNVFHYAGHGRYEDDRPQASGLVLSDGSGARALTANDLSLLAGSGLQLVFLSCCLGAVNKRRPEPDDFYGIFHALAVAEVPAVVGYRWVVPDDSALLFASTFYSQLWRTLCPGEATLEARREAAMGEWGRDDHTWAAPVLMLRSP